MPQGNDVVQDVGREKADRKVSGGRAHPMLTAQAVMDDQRMDVWIAAIARDSKLKGGLLLTLEEVHYGVLERDQRIVGLAVVARASDELLAIGEHHAADGDEELIRKFYTRPRNKVVEPELCCDRPESVDRF